MNVSVLTRPPAKVGSGLPREPWPRGQHPSAPGGPEAGSRARATSPGARAPGWGPARPGLQAGGVTELLRACHTDRGRGRVLDRGLRADNRPLVPASVPFRKAGQRDAAYRQGRREQGLHTRLSPRCVPGAARRPGSARTRRPPRSPARPRSPGPQLPASRTPEAGGPRARSWSAQARARAGFLRPGPGDSSPGDPRTPSTVASVSFKLLGVTPGTPTCRPLPAAARPAPGLQPAGVGHPCSTLRSAPHVPWAGGGLQGLGHTGNRTGPREAGR